MVKEIIKDAEIRMSKACEKIRDDLVHIRTGKASSALVDGIKVSSYGSMMPLNQVSTISTPDARSISITPWDKTLLGEIEKAILASELGITPTNDGTNIRLAIPVLTEERRIDLTKLVHKYGEDGKIAVRNIRRDANEHLKKLEKSHEISEDECRNATIDVQELTDNAVKRLDEIVKLKDAEIMKV